MDPQALIKLKSKFTAKQAKPATNKDKPRQSIPIAIEGMLFLAKKVQVVTAAASVSVRQLLAVDPDQCPFGVIYH